FTEALGRVTAGGVPGAAAIVKLRPGDGMIKTKRAAAIGGLVQGGQDMDCRSWIAGEVIPFVGPDPTFGQHAGRGIHAVGDFDGGLLDRRVAYKISANQTAIPGPVV